MNKIFELIAKKAMEQEGNNMRHIYRKAKRHLKRHIRYIKKRLSFREALRLYAGMPVGV